MYEAHQETAAASTGRPSLPSRELLDAVASMRPVRTRAPVRTLLVACAVSSGYVALLLRAIPLRHDLALVVPERWLLVAALWAAGYGLALGAALLPRRREVLPDSKRAALAALLVCVAAILVLPLIPVAMEGHTRQFVGAGEAWLHAKGCVLVGVAAAVVPLLAGLVLLRGLAPLFAGRLGAAAGAAAGALGGLFLHAACDVGDRSHLALAHGGAVLLCASIGALLGSLVLGRAR